MLAKKLTPKLYINKADFGENDYKNKSSNMNLNADKEDDDDEGGQVGSKETNKSEGEKLFHKQEFRKAIDCFTMALEQDVKNPDPLCLVWRSRCWLRLGRQTEALADAEASLTADSVNIHGLLIKAQVLFDIGDFEFALVQFHRGNKLRPELELFRKGVQCCEEVIANCVGDCDHKLTMDGDLTFLDKVHPQIHFMDEEEKKKKENSNKSYNTNANRRPTNDDDDDDADDDGDKGAGFEKNNNQNNDDDAAAAAAAFDALTAVAAANAEGNEGMDGLDGKEREEEGDGGRDGVGTLTVDLSDPNFSTSTSTKKSRTTAFIYEEEENDDDDNDNNNNNRSSNNATPRFKSEAAVRAAVDEAASVTSLELDNANANANATKEGGEGGGAAAAEGGEGKSRGVTKNAKFNVNTNCGICKRPPRTEKAKDEEGVRKWRQPKTCKMLLGELYKDRMYLESLLTDGDLIAPDYPVHKTAKREITKAINYLDGKADYWQRYKPIYARVGDKGQDKKRATGEELALQIQRALEEIDQAHNENRWDDCLSKARLLLANSSKWSAADITNKRVVISALHNYMGVSYTELRRFDRGLREHIMDLEEVSREPVLLDNKSRALENMGKVYAKMGNYTKALISWQQKEPLCKSEYENAWVCHEIGRAYLEMGNFARSRQSSIKAYKFAVDCGDKLWMLHSSVLQAQTEAKMGELQSAYDTFGIALNHAMEVGDDQAAPAIKRALKDIKLRLVRRGQGASSNPLAGAGEGGGGGKDEDEADGASEATPENDGDDEGNENQQDDDAKTDADRDEDDGGNLNQEAGEANEY